MYSLPLDDLVLEGLEHHVHGKHICRRGLLVRPVKHVDNLVSVAHRAREEAIAVLTKPRQLFWVDQVVCKASQAEEDGIEERGRLLERALVLLVLESDFVLDAHHELRRRSDRFKQLNLVIVDTNNHVEVGEIANVVAVRVVRALESRDRLGRVEAVLEVCSPGHAPRLLVDDDRVPAAVALSAVGPGDDLLLVAWQRAHELLHDNLETAIGVDQHIVVKEHELVAGLVRAPVRSVADHGREKLAQGLVIILVKVDLVTHGLGTRLILTLAVKRLQVDDALVVFGMKGCRVTLDVVLPDLDLLRMVVGDKRELARFRIFVRLQQDAVGIADGTFRGQRK